MNLFKDLEGLRGEKMASAGLRMLALRSMALRSAIIRTLSDRSPIGPLLSESHFSCYLEHPTTDEEGGSGSLDLVIEIDGAVIGVESKFFAAFTPSQPEKCESTLERLAAALTQGRGIDQEYCLFVLGPASRRAEIEDKLSGQRRASFVAWETIMERLSSAADQADQFSAQLATELLYFVKSSLAFMPDMERRLPHLLTDFRTQGSELQRSFPKAISDAWPDDTPYLNRGRYWCGFYLSSDNVGYGTHGSASCQRHGCGTGNGAPFSFSLRAALCSLKSDGTKRSIPMSRSSFLRGPVATLLPRTIGS